MRLLLFTAFAMMAFAANSLLNRVAVETYAMPPLTISALRVISGALMLWLILYTLERRNLFKRVSKTCFSINRLYSSVALSLYMIGFSLAYQSLDAGVGALILFGVLQVVLIGWSVQKTGQLSATQAFGVLIALGGLTVLLWPSEGTSIPISSSRLMVAAALGWGAYTLLGSTDSDPFSMSAVHFSLSIPALIILAWPLSGALFSIEGLTLALIAGAITSGLAYALWYAILPQLPLITASISQLSVPVISVLGGAFFLGEALDSKTLISCALVLIGVVLPSLDKLKKDP